MPEHAVVTTDADINRAFADAARASDLPLAKSVEHVRGLNLLIVALSTGRRLVLPVEDLQGLERATDQQLEAYELLGGGTGIRFPELDADFYVPALTEGVYGSRRWMSRLEEAGSVYVTAGKQDATGSSVAGGE